MMSLTTFDFNSQAVRVMEREGQPWFVAADVCRVLEIANSRDAVSGLDEDEKGVGNADTPGGSQKMSLISESGLYALVFKSRKPEARTFRKWVTSEVLPAIRRTGAYQIPALESQATPRVRTVRDDMSELRGLLLTSASAVQLKMLDVGRAQQVANLAARFLETIKLEGDAIGYETLFEMRAGEGGGGLLQAGERPSAKPLQGVPQRGLPRTAAGEPGLPDATVCGEEALGGAEPPACGAAQPPLPGATDLGPEADGCAEPVPGTGDGAVGAE
jgi:prophage antirepressor-like protein